jgi:hypothetical protein
MEDVLIEQHKGFYDSLDETESDKIVDFKKNSIMSSKNEQVIAFNLLNYFLKSILLFFNFIHFQFIRCLMKKKYLVRLKSI